MGTNTEMLASLDKMNDDAFREWLKDENEATYEEKALIAKTKLLRGVCSGDGASATGVRVGVAHGYNYLGVAQSAVRGWLEVVSLSASATVGSVKPGNVVLAQVAAGGGTVLDDTYASYGRLLVETETDATPANRHFDYKMTVTGAQAAAGFGLQMQFRLLRGHPLVDIMGIEEHDDFS